MMVRGRVLPPALFAGACLSMALVTGAMLAGLIAPERSASYVDKLLLSSICILSLITSLRCAARAFRARGVLVRIDHTGLWDRRISANFIPWSAVIDATRIRLNQADYLVLRLRPSYETSRSFQATTTVSYRFRRLFGYLGLYVRAGDLQCSFADLSAACKLELVASRCRHAEQAGGQDPEVADPSEKELIELRRRSPVLTFVLIGLLSCIFLAEVSKMSGDIHSTLTPTALHQLGALDRQSIADGELWRFLMAPLLHASLGHLFGNCVVLGFAGYLLEPLVGAAGMAGIFAVCALCGGLTSIWLNPALVVSVGASGGIIGLMTFGFTRALQYPTGAMRSTLLVGSARVLLPTLASILIARGGSHVDHAAHLGGGVAGIAIAVLLYAARSAKRGPRLAS